MSKGPQNTSPQALHRQLGMTDDEFDRVNEVLGREPNNLELAMFSVMWSEHCSYKSSKKYLGRFPTVAPWVMVGPGEGAGVIDVGDDLAIAIRIESHNHPSAIEPYQGAATGVGGIIRDILSMGARPIALMDPLRFGSLQDARTRYLFEGVVSGISGYGNAVGVPTVGGEAIFDDCYRDNPLVNVLCLGLLKHDQLMLARAEGVGNLAVLLGSATGRDGIGGASVLASAGFDEGLEGDASAKRPSVQVGDPFEEKRLIEACLALLDAGLAVGVQDLGAAGLSCAASESAANAGMGMDVDVTRVARREPGMDPVEVMTSESQERMLAIVTPENLDEVLELCQRWEVRAGVVGVVTDTGRFRILDGAFDSPLDTYPSVPGGRPPSPPGELEREINGSVIADVPCASLGDGPTYDRPLSRPSDLDDRQADDPWNSLAAQFDGAIDLSGELLSLLSTPAIADRSWIWRQYDHQLFLNTVAGPGANAAILRLKGTSRAVALSTDGKARFCALDPRTGGRLVVLEAARNVACSGARPLALVNCLNFGNPEHPEVMWEFSEVVAGMSEACEALGIPVVGGNVSFYNESRGADIDPTPVAGVIGLIDDFTGPPPGTALVSGTEIVVLGETRPELGGSEWATVVHGLRFGMPPEADLDATLALHQFVASLVNDRVVTAIHDCSDGGLAVALAEMAISGGVGFEVDLTCGEDLNGLAPAVALFSESPSRVVVAAESHDLASVLETAKLAGVTASHLGTATGDQMIIRSGNSQIVGVGIDQASAVWREALPEIMSAAH